MLKQLEFDEVSSAQIQVWALVAAVPFIWMSLAEVAYGTTVHYDMDFNSATINDFAITQSNQSLISASGPGLPWGSNFGVPSLQSIGSFSDRAVLLDVDDAGSRGDQVRAELGLGFSNYHIEFDLELHGLAGGTATNRNIFQVNLLANSRLTFRHWEGVSLSSVSRDVFGAVRNDTPMHVELDLDYGARTLTTAISGIGSQTVALNLLGSTGDLPYVDFEFGNPGGAGGGGTVDGSWAAIDNLIISSQGEPGPPVIPLPTTGILFGSALGLLGWARRKQA